MVGKEKSTQPLFSKDRKLGAKTTAILAKHFAAASSLLPIDPFDDPMGHAVQRIKEAGIQEIRIGPGVGGFPRRNQAGLEEVAAARERVRWLLAKPMARDQVLVVGPSVYQNRMPYLPKLVEETWGAVQERIFFDPASGDPRQRAMDRSLWAGKIFNPDRQQFPQALFLGDEEEFRDFNQFAQHIHFDVQPLKTPRLEDPVRLLLDLLQWMGVQAADLSQAESEQLKSDLTLLIQA